jgi:hypothetical protein
MEWTMTEHVMRNEERAHSARFQRWHFAKYLRWPSGVLRLLMEKMNGRSDRFDQLVWHTLEQDPPRERDPRYHPVIADPFYVALFDMMDGQPGLARRYDGGQGAMSAAVDGIRQAVREANWLIPPGSTQ